MQKSIVFWIERTYKKNRPEIAQDASPSEVLNDLMKKLRRRWQTRFDEAAPALANYFAQKMKDRSDAQLRQILKDGGFSVQMFKLTRPMNDVLRATVHKQVSLISNIADQHLTQIEGLVMRSVAEGRNLYGLSLELQKRYHITQRRAALIARDQNNEATAVMNRVRQMELGITKAIWMHSHGGKVPRPTHLANDGKPYDIAKGWLDPAIGKRIWPGTEINCLPAESVIDFADGVEVAYRRWYTGNLTEIITEDGKTLRATPNHPVLTQNGWIAIGALNEGDYVLQIADDIIDAPMRKNNIDDAISLIADIFYSIRNAPNFGLNSIIAVGAKFHGDFSNGDVDIVRPARPLYFGFEIMQRFCHFPFTKTDAPAFGLRAFMKSIQTILSVASRIVGRGGQFFSTLYSFMFQANFVGRATIPHCSTSSNNSANDSVSRNMIQSGQGQDACPIFMFPTKPVRIIKVNRSKFDGHVFNLQTTCGWYVSGGIIVHNCRCTSRSIVPGFE